jgi:glycosyltransferase involved in cell wall biosynthesis
MIVTAILAIRNEEAYLANCLRHLMRNGVRFAIIDNGSIDASAQIYRSAEFAPGLVEVARTPFDGTFCLADQLRDKMKMAERIETDWLVHLDADEIMHSFRPGESLSEAIGRMAAEGWNVINFDEFVFLPLERDYVVDAPEHQPMPDYYFFEPSFPRLMRAWQKAEGFSLTEGGHSLTGPDLRLSPETLAVRHYIVRSQGHALRKYPTRRFAADEVAAGWHVNRIGHRMESFLFPSPDQLKRLAEPGARDLDRSEPWPVHYWERGELASAS